MIITWVERGEREEIPSGAPQVLREVIKNCWVAEPKSRPLLSSIIAQLNAAMATTTEAKDRSKRRCFNDRFWIEFE